MLELLYVADPMCSWCWGFAAELHAVRNALPQGVRVRYVMGGLAPDTDEPMPEDMRRYVQAQWRAVAECTGAAFNWDFWTRCRPRRSTWPACRAVGAAGRQNDAASRRMFEAIQRAYYVEARNPSDAATLIELARDFGLDVSRFEHDLTSREGTDRLRSDLELARALGVGGFPTLVFRRGERSDVLHAGWAPAAEIVPRLQSLL